MFIFFFQAEDGIRDIGVTGVQTCALPISAGGSGVGGNLVAVEAGGVSFAGQSSKAIFSFNRVGAAAVAGLQLWSVWQSAGVRHRALLSAGDRSPFGATGHGDLSRRASCIGCGALLL